MRRPFYSVIAIILLAATLLSFTGCKKQEKEIENLLTEFEYACNMLDFDAVLSCINPKVSDKIKIVVGIVGMFKDKETDEMFESLAEHISNDEIGGTDFFSSVKIDVKSIVVEEDSATVSTIINYEFNGSEMVRSATFSCVYYAEKWYISSFSID